MRRINSLHIVILAVTLSLLMGGCSTLQPVRSALTNNPADYYIAPPKVATATPTQSLQRTDAAQPANCTNVLSFEKDLSIPDGTFINPGASLDKQWLVRNSGTCNWNKSYTIQMINGDALGAASPQAIVPARSGSESTIRIIFTAPSQPGNYSSTWQAFDPDGQPFGDYFSIVFNVANK